MATRPTYCTERDLKDVFPHIDEFDSKTPIYGWVVHSGSLYRADNCGLITLLFADGQDLGDAEANSGVVDVNGEWYYDSALDAVYYYNDATNPIDLLMEAGVDWATLKTRYMGNASRFLDSRLDPKLPRERIKDKDGNYDYIIIRSTALITAVFLIRSHDPNSEIAKAMMDEVDGNIASLNGGEATLSWQVTQDSSHGIIREVGSPTAGLRPVDTRGEWSGTWDLLKLKITLAGAIGTAKYSVWTKDSTSGLKSNQVVTDEIITGDYQALSGGLQIRFQGTDDSATATLNDEWEVEVMGREEIADTGVRSVRNTRGS